MKKKYTFIIGFILGALLFGGFVYAATTLLEVHFVPLKYYYNGFELKPVPGEEGFIYEGRTYVPLRFVSENMGKDVAWNGDHYQIDIIDSKKSSQNTKIGNFQQLYSEMAIDNDWIYCFDSDSSSILRWQKNSSEKETVITDVSGLLAVKDNWVYYSVEQKPASFDYSLYRISADGTNREKITDAKYLEWLYVTNDWIYTSNARFRIDTLEKQEYSYPIEDTLAASDVNGGITYLPLFTIDDWMYCIQIEDTRETQEIPQIPVQKHSLVKINSNNLQEKEVILPHEVIHASKSFGGTFEPIDTFSYANNHIYMSSQFVGVVNVLDLTTGELKEVEALSSTTILEFDVDGEWIYYEDARDGNLYKSQLDGTKKTKLLEADENLSFYKEIKVLDGRICFVRYMDDVTNNGTGFQQYGSMDINGKNLKICD